MALTRLYLSAADSIKLWSQLSLSPSLEIPRPGVLPSKADLSILLGHEKPSNSATNPRAWLSSNIHLKAPGSVLSAEFRRLHISFDFHTNPRERRPRAKRTKIEVKAHDAADTRLFDISSAGSNDKFHKGEEPPPRTKRRKTKTNLDGMDDTTLLDESSLVIDDKYLKGLEQVVGSLSRGLSKSIASCFDSMEIMNVDQRRFVQPSKVPKEFGAALILTNKTQGDGKSLGHTAISLFPEAKISPPVWRRDGSYSDDMLLDAQPDEEDMLLLSDRNLALPTASEPSDSKILLSRTTENTSSLVSPSTIISTGSASSSIYSLKRSLPSDATISMQAVPLSGLNISPACKLAEVALRILIGGYEPRRTRGLLGVRVDKPLLQTSLSDIAPGVFSPAFKEVRRLDALPSSTVLTRVQPMSHNAQYLPTISQAISHSWPRNVQSPIFMQKLSQLANSPPSSLEHNDEDAMEEATTERLASVVQARLWSMMQKKLYDPTAARILFNPRSSDKTTAESEMIEEEYNLVDELGDKSVPLGRERIMEDLEDFMRDEFGDEDEFEDLLGGVIDEEDDLLGYLDASEREMVEVEQETDEMLFGNSAVDDYWEHGDEMLLLEPGSEDEYMLL